MVELKGSRLYFVIVGVIQIVLSLIFVVCTKIVLEKYSDVPGFAAYSLFYLYYAIPGVLCILAGVRSRQKTYVKASLGFHVISIVLSTIGAAISSVFWQMYKEPDVCKDNAKGKCICFEKSYSIGCDDGNTARHLLAVLTAANILMILTSFIASILGCTTVCCDPMPTTEQRTSRMETSHSEQTVISHVNHSHHAPNPIHAPAQTAAVQPSTDRTSFELKSQELHNQDKPTLHEKRM